jgi:phenylacetate-CoA ligase
MTDTVAAFLGALAETERLDPERMRLYQRRLLDRLLRHARAETDFYRDRLAPLFRDDDSIDWDRWREVPILTRAVAQESFDALVARTVPPHVGKAIEDTTSGSTGKPFRHFTSQIQVSASAIANERFFRWHQLDPTALTAQLRAAENDPDTAYPHGRFATGWRPGHPGSRAATLSIAGISIEQQIEWLSRVRPTYLIAYPSNLQEMARIARAGGVKLDLDGVLTFGEMTTPDAYEAIRDYFGCRPLDRYGSTEVGLVSATCPHSGRQHVMAELVLVEIVGEDGKPVPPGVPGRVVTTPFYNFAMPLIRYDIGDYAAFSSEACGCGRTLPTLSAIYGRARNVFRYMDGSSGWPVVRSREIGAFVPHRQYQLVQVARDRLELRYVPIAAHQANDMRGLTEYVRKRLHPSVSITTVAMDEIPRSKGGKYEDCVSLVAAR